MRIRRSASPINDDDRGWHEIATRHRAEELPLLRGVVERWRTTLASLTALFGAAGIVAAPRVAADLPPAWKSAAGVLVLAVFGLMIASTWFAGRAAQGSLERVAGGFEAIREHWLKEEMRARHAIRRSQFTALAAAGLLVAAIGLLWFAPGQATDYLILDRGGSRQCLPLDDAGKVGIVLDPRTTVSVGSACTERR